MSKVECVLSVPPELCPDGNTVRMFGTLDQPAWAATDVGEALGLVHVRQAMADLDDDEKGVIIADTLGGKQRLAVVYEPGLYALVIKSRKKEARQFRRWLLHEVLPSIRKFGCYPAPADRPFVPTLQPYYQRVQLLGAVRRAIPSGHWAVFCEGSDLLVTAEQAFGAAALEMTALDLLDGSVGTHWSHFRNGQSWAGKRVPYAYTFPAGDPRGTVRAWAYPMPELPFFRTWLHGQYSHEHLPAYVARKFGPGAMQKALPALARAGVQISA